MARPKMRILPWQKIRRETLHTARGLKPRMQSVCMDSLIEGKSPEDAMSEESGARTYLDGKNTCCYQSQHRRQNGRSKHEWAEKAQGPTMRNLGLGSANIQGRKLKRMSHSCASGTHSTYNMCIIKGALLGMFVCYLRMGRQHMIMVLWSGMADRRGTGLAKVRDRSGQVRYLIQEVCKEY